jgi:acylphosphatase
MVKKIKVHVFVSGQVQGVFFRDSAKKKALELDIFGWVSNLPDGRVEAIFEGEEKKVREMIDWFRQGPAFAKVENISIIADNYSGEFNSFEIK